MEREDWMRLALALAREAGEAGEVPVGCVIVKDGAVVGRGRNRREGERTALGHAEIEAIADACRTLGGWRLRDCTLYVTLEPCPMCAGAIVNARIPVVCYGARDDKAGWWAGAATGGRPAAPPWATRRSRPSPWPAKPWGAGG